MSFFGLIVEAASPVRAMLAGFPKLLKRKERAVTPGEVRVAEMATTSGTQVGDIVGVDELKVEITVRTTNRK